MHKRTVQVVQIQVDAHGVPLNSPVLNMNY